MAQETRGNEIVFSDEDFEHSNSVRLLLDFLVHGVAGRGDHSIEHISDAIDLTLKYDCHCGYEFCIAYVDRAFRENLTDTEALEILIQATQLDETRLACLVVRDLARQQYYSTAINQRITGSGICCKSSVSPPSISGHFLRP